MDKVTNLRNLQPQERKAILALLEILEKELLHSIRHVVLFGSKARGDSDAESDIDLLIVVEEYSWALEKEITRLTTQADYAHNVVLSDHIIGKARFEQMAARREPLYCNLEREGIDLWTLESHSIT